MNATGTINLNKSSRQGNISSPPRQLTFMEENYLNTKEFVETVETWIEGSEGIRRIRPASPPTFFTKID